MNHLRYACVGFVQVAGDVFFEHWDLGVMCVVWRLVLEL
jgi:hypothetical protein